MGKDVEKRLMKAEQLDKAMQYKRAAKLFNAVGTEFLKLGDIERAKDCFFNAARCAINEDKYLSTLKSIFITENFYFLRHYLKN